MTQQWYQLVFANDGGIGQELAAALLRVWPRHATMTQSITVPYFMHECSSSFYVPDIGHFAAPAYTIALELSVMEGPDAMGIKMLSLGMLDGSADLFSSSPLADINMQTDTMVAVGVDRWLKVKGRVRLVAGSPIDLHEHILNAWMGAH